jgi:hypothetical protein
MKLFQQCKILKHLCALLVMLMSTVCTAKTNRAPANFVPNDDVIIVPLEYETHFLVRNIDPNHPKLKKIKNQLDYWVTQEKYVTEWAIEDTGLYRPASQEEKLNFFKKNFLRYVSRKARDPLKRDLKEWWNSDNAEAEVSRVNQVTEEINTKEKGAFAKKINKQKVLAKTQKFKLRFKPRVLKGYVSLSLRSVYFNADSVVGINGKIDFKISRGFSSIGLNTMAYYNYSDNRLITSFSKSLTKTISTSITSTLAPEELVTEDHRFSLNYSKSF